MRKVLAVAALLATGLVAQAAYADPSPTSGGSGGAASAAVAALVVPLLPPIERIIPLTRTVNVADPFNLLKGVIRHRFASQMVDLYPSDGSGFHLSVGTRFYKKQYVRRDQMEATNGLLYEPRMPRGGFGQRGFRRATPAVTAGYTEMVDSNLMLGVEAGTMLGRAVDHLPRGERLGGIPGAGRNEAGMRMNPVVNLTVGYAF